MSFVRAKKHLGQHFLKEESIAHKIAQIPFYSSEVLFIEVGPGMGVLTKFILAQNPKNFYAIEIDSESVAYLRTHFPDLSLIEGDFFKLDVKMLMEKHQCSQVHIIGNFPYHLSSDFFLYIFDHRAYVHGLTGMFQKEVCQRICAQPKTKQYGILSVYLQSVFEVKYHFDVSSQLFIPPPKVESGVISIEQSKNKSFTCSEDVFRKVVRGTFQQRRKMLRNTLKQMVQDANTWESLKQYHELRPEQLSPVDFQYIASILEKKVSC